MGVIIFKDWDRRFRRLWDLECRDRQTNIITKVLRKRNAEVFRRHVINLELMPGLCYIAAFNKEIGTEQTSSAER